MIILTIAHPVKGKVTINLPDDAKIEVMKISVAFVSEIGILQTWVIDKQTTITITNN